MPNFYSREIALKVDHLRSSHSYLLNKNPIDMNRDISPLAAAQRISKCLNNFEPTTNYSAELELKNTYPIKNNEREKKRYLETLETIDTEANSKKRPPLGMNSYLDFILEY